MSKKSLIIVAAVVIFGSIVTGGLYYSNNYKSGNKSTGNKGAIIQSHPTYTLNLISGKSYLAAKPEMMQFAIQDQNGKILKDFDTVHEKKLHLIVVRKDRSYFQHVHPTLDEKTGMFMIEPFTFPTDGEYRVYADFTPLGAQMDAMGIKLAATPYQDVKVGDLSKYTGQLLGSDKFTSDAGGLQTKLSLLDGGDGPSTGYISGVELPLAIDVNKDGAAFKNLETYLGALGHMVILGPNLEFVHAHPSTTDTANQTGLILFNALMPVAGQYKLYLQTQVGGQVNTTDYTVTINPKPQTSTTNNNQSMQRMNHKGH